MLDQRDATELINDIWDRLELVAQLPEEDAGFLEQQGPMRGKFNSQRAYHRYYLRSKAILKRGNEFLGIYTKDVSRQSLGMLAPIQLLPVERVHAWLPNGSDYELEITRCHYISDYCYECGARFVFDGARPVPLDEANIPSP